MPNSIIIRTDEGEVEIVPNKYLYVTQFVDGGDEIDNKTKCITWDEVGCKNLVIGCIEFINTLMSSLTK